MYRIHCRRCPRALCQWNNCVFASSILLGEQLLLSLGNTHSSHAYQSLSLASWALKSMVRADQGLIGQDPKYSTLITPAGTSRDKLHSFLGLLDSFLSHLFLQTMPPAFPSPSFLPSQQYRVPHTHIQNPPSIYFLYFRKYCGAVGRR